MSDNRDIGEEEEEDDDAFPIDSGSPILLDRETLERIANQGRPGPPSVATTALASAVGSTIGDPRDAFLKSITFIKSDTTDEMGWGINFMPPSAAVTGGKKRFTIRRSNRPKLIVDSVSGIFALSKIKEGDFLKTINKKTVGPSMTPELAVQRMNEVLQEDGYLSVAFDNKDLGDDIMVQATVLKPRPDMTYEEMGLVVWIWGFLCIKSIDKETSIFRHTVLKSNDHIVQINDIECDGLKPAAFAKIVSTLPLEITITVLRRKQRFTGKFG